MSFVLDPSHEALTPDYVHHLGVRASPITLQVLVQDLGGELGVNATENIYVFYFHRLEDLAVGPFLFVETMVQDLTSLLVP